MNLRYTLQACAQPRIELEDDDREENENDDHDQEVGEVSRSQYLMWIGNELSGAVKRISELSCLSFIPPGYIL